MRSEIEAIEIHCDACGAGSYLESHAKTVDAILSLVESKLPKEKTRSEDLADIIEHELFQFDNNPQWQRLIAIGRINGFNQALTEVKKQLEIG